MEDLRHPQAGEGLAPDLQAARCALFAPDDLPIGEAHAYQFRLVVEVVELVAGALVGLAGHEVQLVVAVQVHLEGLATQVGTLEQAFLDIGIAHRRQQRGEPVEA
ncbi:hypothetical protein FQZ97_1148920 [compost metagenome]